MLHLALLLLAAQVHSDVLKAQLKAAEEERHATARELSEKLLKVDRLNNKYDIICGKLGDEVRAVATADACMHRRQAALPVLVSPLCATPPWSLSHHPRA